MGDYMGLELSEAVLRENMPEYLNSVAIYQQQVSVTLVNSQQTVTKIFPSLLQ